MEESIEIAGISIPMKDWEATPATVRAVVLVLSERLSNLEERLNQNSQNSSRPPSNDGPTKPSKPAVKKQASATKSQGFGHKPKQAPLYPLEACTEVHVLIPERCDHCGEVLSGKASNPQRHQIIDLPPMSLEVVEYQRPQLTCDCCGRSTRAPLPPDIPSGHDGDRLASFVSWLSAEHYQSYRLAQSWLKACFGLELSRGSLQRLRQRVSEAIEHPVDEAHEYVKTQDVLYPDETSFGQGNKDGNNPTKTKGWLWGVMTKAVKAYRVVLSRSQASAKELIGEQLKAIVVSDRYSAYGWLDVCHRQVCWAHLKRDLTAIAQRRGVSQQIGEGLLKLESQLFRSWHRVRDGTLTREQFKTRVEPLRAAFNRELIETAELPIGPEEKTPLVKTVRTVRKLLEVEPALWTFVEREGIEPTNNTAERGLRSVVIWRGISFGSESEQGSRFVERMMSVSASLKAQGRNAIDFLVEACREFRTGQTPPSLIPQS